jgi:hypothetical protein
MGNGSHRKVNQATVKRDQSAWNRRHWAAIRRLPVTALGIEGTSCAIDAAQSRLRLQPVVGTRHAVIWDVMATTRAIRLTTAASADCHPAVRLWRVVLIEAPTDVRSFR